MEGETLRLAEPGESNRTVLIDLNFVIYSTNYVELSFFEGLDTRREPRLSIDIVNIAALQKGYVQWTVLKETVKK